MSYFGRRRMKAFIPMVLLLMLISMLAVQISPSSSAQTQNQPADPGDGLPNQVLPGTQIVVGHSVKHDHSIPLRNIKATQPTKPKKEQEANPNPKTQLKHT